MTKDKAIAELVRIWNSPHLDLSLKAGLGEAIDALKGEDGDLISRQAAIDAWDKLSKRGRTEFDQVLMTLPSAGPKTGRDCTDFVRWLMDEVMDEENWQMNAVAYGEIICRKLKKLGLLDVVDGYYVETQKTGAWIPVGERLPSESGWYFVTVQGVECVSDMVWYYHESHEWNGVSETQKVIAWMPLPEPYKGGDDE